MQCCSGALFYTRGVSSVLRSKWRVEGWGWWLCPLLHWIDSLLILISFSFLFSFSCHLSLLSRLLSCCSCLVTVHSASGSSSPHGTLGPPIGVIGTVGLGSMTTITRSYLRLTTLSVHGVPLG